MIKIIRDIYLEELLKEFMLGGMDSKTPQKLLLIRKLMLSFDTDTVQYVRLGEIFSTLVRNKRYKKCTNT